MNRIHDTNLMTPGLRNKSTIQIFQIPYGFANPKHRICMDLYLIYVLRFVRIRWIRDNRSNLLKIGWIRMYNTKQIFPSPDSWTTIRYESGIRIIRYKSNLFEVRIHTHDTVRIHVFTNLLYDSRILTKNIIAQIKSKIQISYQILHSPTVVWMEHGLSVLVDTLTGPLELRNLVGIRN